MSHCCNDGGAPTPSTPPPPDDALLAAVGVRRDLHIADAPAADDLLARLAVLPAGELVIGGDPVALAELLDLPLATEIVAGTVEGAGEPVAWAELGEVVVACHTLGVDVPDGGLRRHDALWIDLHRPATGRHRVPVWREPDGPWHAEDPLRALLALLAH